MAYTGPRGTNPDRNANRATHTSRAPGSGSSSRGGSNVSFGHNPLGFLANAADEYYLSPVNSLTRNLTRNERSQGQLYNAMGRTARYETRYYQEDATRDVAKANQNFLHDRAEARLLDGN